jgi:hypothetical protein
MEVSSTSIKAAIATVAAMIHGLTLGFHCALGYRLFTHSTASQSRGNQLQEDPSVPSDERRAVERLHPNCTDVIPPRRYRRLRLRLLSRIAHADGTGNGRKPTSEFKVDKNSGRPDSRHSRWAKYREWHTNLYCSSRLGRTNVKLSAHALNPFTHTCNPHSSKFRARRKPL